MLSYVIHYLKAHQNWGMRLTSLNVSGTNSFTGWTFSALDTVFLYSVRQYKKTDIPNLPSPSSTYLLFEFHK